MWWCHLVVLIFSCKQCGREILTTKIGTNRSDRSMRSPSTIREFYRFRSVNGISWGVSLLHPINIKGHSRLRKQPNRINQIHLTLSCFYLSFSLPYFSNLDMLFLLRLHGVWRRPSWPAEPRANQGVPAPTGSLPGGRSLDPRRAAPTRPVWPAHHTGLTVGAARSCVGPE